MPKETKQKKQDLGIFYTDQRIADFVFDILKIWKDKEEKESGRWESRKHFPSVIDPAVGEGVFLKAAIETGFTKTDYIFGLDIDEEVVKKWKQINLLKEFGGKEEDLEAHFFHQNGLDKIHWEQHRNKYQHKLKQKDISVQQFDAVIGNPPYGGLGVYDEMKTLATAIWQAEKVQKIERQTLNTLFGEEVEKVIKHTETIHQKISLPSQKILDLLNLSESLLKFEMWKDKKYIPQRISHKVKISGVDFNIENLLTFKEIEKLKSFSIEILFLERFIQLAKPGGWIAIIIPDGILTNSNSHYVREFVSERAKVEAIVSLPRDAFKNVGTSAKTSILFLQKYKDQEKKQENYPIFLASVDSLDEKNFNFIKNTYQKYYNKNMSKKNLVQTTTDEKGREIVMVRVDKTFKEIMTACQIDKLEWGRWDVKYWLPKYEKNINEIKNSDWPKKRFYEILDMKNVIQGSKGVSQYTESGIQYLTIENIVFTGFDFAYKPKFVKPNGPMDIAGSRPKYGYVVLVRTGATIGKVVVVTDENPNYTITSVAYKLKFRKDINPFYVCVFLKSSFGQTQLHQLKNGTGVENLNLDSEVPFLLIPVISETIQDNVESEYKKMSKYHDRAMEAKKKGNDAEYKKNIETAEKMLKDLIAKTEAVIRGERKDVI